MNGIVVRLPALFLFLILAAATSVLPARGASPDSGAAGLRITSEPPGLRIFNDTAFIGTTPYESGALPAGIFRFRVFGADPGRWASPGIFDSAMLVEGETVERHVVLPRFVRISTDPDGAEIRLGDSVLGRTPLFALLPQGAVTLSAIRAGYRDRLLMVPAGLGSVHAVMTPAGTGAAVRSPLAGTGSKSPAPLIVAGSVAVVSGAVSAYLKTRADHYYDDYRVSGDGATLDRVRRFDLFSGIALGVTELSLGYLIMELLSR